MDCLILVARRDSLDLQKRAAGSGLASCKLLQNARLDPGCKRRSLDVVQPTDMVDEENSPGPRCPSCHQQSLRFIGIVVPMEMSKRTSG